MARKIDNELVGNARANAAGVDQFTVLGYSVPLLAGQESALRAHPSDEQTSMGLNVAD
jgi:hypothetical protein